jgi:hypothetical protein
MELPMASRRFKLLAVAGLTTALLAAVPAVSSAKSHYTGKLPPAAVDMAPVEPTVIPPDTMVPSSSTTAAKHHKATSKKSKKLSTASAKHKKVKKHKKTTKVRKV